MKYMLMFWDDDSAEEPADGGPAMLAAIRSWVDEMTARGIRLDSAAPSAMPPRLGSCGSARAKCWSPTVRTWRPRSRWAATT